MDLSVPEELRSRARTVGLSWLVLVGERCSKIMLVSILSRGPGKVRFSDLLLVRTASSSSCRPDAAPTSLWLGCSCHDLDCGNRGCFMILLAAAPIPVKDCPLFADSSLRLAKSSSSNAKPFQEGLFHLFGFVAFILIQVVLNTERQEVTFFFRYSADYFPSFTLDRSCSSSAI